MRDILNLRNRTTCIHLIPTYKNLQRTTSKQIIYLYNAQPIHVAATNNFIPFCLALLLANFISSAFTLVKCMRNLAVVGNTGMLLKAYKETAMVQLESKLNNSGRS